MRAIISVIGKDTVGILAKVSGICAEHKVNILDVTQTILQDMFAMIMMVDISGLDCEFHELSELLRTTGESMNLDIHIMHEDIFNSMHRI